MRDLLEIITIAVWYGLVSYVALFIADNTIEVVGLIAVALVGIGLIRAILGMREDFETTYTQTPDYNFEEYMDSTETCTGCGEEFDTNDGHTHGKIGRDYYCESCSEVAQVVMEHYEEWLPTTEDVRERNT